MCTTSPPSPVLKGNCFFTSPRLSLFCSLCLKMSPAPFPHLPHLQSPEFLLMLQNLTAVSHLLCDVPARTQPEPRTIWTHTSLHNSLRAFIVGCCYCLLSHFLLLDVQLLENKGFISFKFLFMPLGPDVSRGRPKGLHHRLRVSSQT